MEGKKKGLSLDNTNSNRYSGRYCLWVSDWAMGLKFKIYR